MLMKNIKNKLGISLIVISVSALIILTMLSVITYSLIENMNKAKKIEFAQEINMIQMAVDSYYDENNSYPVGQTITLSGMSDTVKQEQFIDEEHKTQGYVFNIINYDEIGITNLKYGDSSRGTNDIYVVSTLTGKVYYALGVSIGDKIYFTASYDILNLINGEENNGINDYTSKAILYVENLKNDGSKDITIKIPKEDSVVSVKADSTTINLPTNQTDSKYYLYNYNAVKGCTIIVQYKEENSEAVKYNYYNVNI